MNALQQYIRGAQDRSGGFLRETDMPDLIKLDRLCPLLVRCGNCRFTCAAQDVAHLIKCVHAGGDYLRDVSFPVGSFEQAAGWIEKPSIAKCVHNAGVTKAANLLAPKPDGRKLRTYDPGFNESDCGGVWDGFTVSSDADAGL